MRLKTLCWNLHTANAESPAWRIIEQLNPDIATLQEVNSIPLSLKQRYTVYFRKASKTYAKQKFGSVILSKFPISTDLEFISDYDWANREISHFEGNLLNCTIAVRPDLHLHTVSVYSPPWKINGDRINSEDLSVLQLENNVDFWLTELLWGALKRCVPKYGGNWFVAGDFNSSVTFDTCWGKKPRGNQEIIDRLNSIGLRECIHDFHGRLVPTYRHPNGSVVHQMDHCYVSPGLRAALKSCRVRDDLGVFEGRISDHLPIEAEFEVSD